MTTYRSGVPFKLAKPRATNPYHREARPDALAFWTGAAGPVTVTTTMRPVPDVWADKTPEEVLADTNAVVEAMRAEQKPRDITAEMLAEFRRLYPAMYETWLQEVRKNGR